MQIRNTCVGVTLAATFMLGASLVAQEAGERFTYVAAGTKDPSVYGAYSTYKDGSRDIPERLNFSITRYSTDAERDTVFSTASKEGVAKVGEIVRTTTA